MATPLPPLPLLPSSPASRRPPCRPCGRRARRAPRARRTNAVPPDAPPDPPDPLLALPPLEPDVSLVGRSTLTVRASPREKPPPGCPWKTSTQGPPCSRSRSLNMLIGSQSGLRHLMRILVPEAPDGPMAFVAPSGCSCGAGRTEPDETA